MKKGILLLLVALLSLTTLFADTSELQVTFDLTSASAGGGSGTGEGGEDDTWVKNIIGFTTETITDIKSDINATTTLTLGASTNDFTLVGEGTAYVYWQIISPNKIVVTASSDVLTNGSDTLDWSTEAWKEQIRGTSDSTVYVDGPGNDLSFSAGDYSEKAIVTHDPTKGMASYGYITLAITTADASTLPTGTYTTTITLTITES